ncbi:hypothetical protein Tco_0973419 [Tanacetum coccineum]
MVVLSNIQAYLDYDFFDGHRMQSGGRKGIRFYLMEMDCMLSTSGWVVCELIQKLQQKEVDEESCIKTCSMNWKEANSVYTDYIVSSASNGKIQAGALIFVLMTTSVINNLIFRGFFEKQKLTGPNFINWYRQLRIVLSVEDKLNYLEHPIPVAPVPAQAGQQVALEALAAHAAWVKGSKEIVGLMLMTMESDIQRNLENLGAYEMLQELKTQFAQQAEQELLQTMREFHSCKHEEGQSVSSYILKMKSYIDNLECLSHPVSLGLGVGLILISLRKEFDSFVQNYNMHSMGKIINELHAMLKLYEQTLPKNNAHALYAIRAEKGKNKLAYAPKPKIFPPPNREDPAKDSRASSSGIFTIELYTFPNKSWVYDTGCGTYICNITHGLRGSRKLKPGALSLYVGNGVRDMECYPKDSYTNVSSMYALSNKRAKSELDSSLLSPVVSWKMPSSPQTRYVFVLNGGAVDWKSAKQRIFATLSAEAEYIAAYDASKEAVWVKKFISGLGAVPTIEEPINMYYENTGAITIANESGITKGVRHFREPKSLPRKGY